MATSTLDTIHVIGVGNLGKLVAHSLVASLPALPVTLIFHRPDLAAQWVHADRCIDVTTNGISVRQCRFQTENTCGDLEEAGSPIKHLVVATKTHTTAAALKPLRHRLNNETSLLFLQNGMGTMEEVTDLLFRDASSRPYYIAGVVSHGVYSTGPFSIVHAGLGSIILGRVNPLRTSDNSASITSTKGLHPDLNHLLQCFTKASALSASVVSAQALLQTQLVKLAINATINPLTAIFNCLNGELLKRPLMLRLIRDLSEEISPVLQAMHASSIAGSTRPQSTEALSPRALEQAVIHVATQTAKNTSSMRQDVLANRKTEIDYINGYIVRRAQENGVCCRLNCALIDMIENRPLDGKPFQVEAILSQ